MYICNLNIIHVLYIYIYIRIQIGTLCLDGWTNVKTEKITNTVLVNKDAAWYITSSNNGFDRNDAVALLNKMSPIIDSLLEKNIRVTGISTDNEAVMLKLVELLKQKYPWLIGVPCIAHTIQLIVDSIRNHPHIVPIYKFVQSVINQFLKHKSYRQKLFQHQKEKNNNTAPLNLIKINDTRWSSFYFALERFIKLKEHIIASLPEEYVHSEHWMKLKDIANLLHTFQIATDKVQHDHCSLLDVYFSFRMIRQTLETKINNKQTPDYIKNVCEETLKQLKTRWDNNVNIPATVASVLLAGGVYTDNGPDYLSPDDIQQGKQFIIDWGTDFLKKFYPELCRDMNAVATNLANELYNFNEGIEVYAKFKQQLQDNFKQNKIMVDDIISMFKFVAITRPNSYLPRLAMALIETIATESSVERTFSAQSDVHAKDRNKLNNDSVVAEMFLKFNAESIIELSKSGGCKLKRVINWPEVVLNADDSDEENDNDDDTDDVLDVATSSSSPSSSYSSSSSYFSTSSSSSSSSSSSPAPPPAPTRQMMTL